MMEDRKTIANCFSCLCHAWAAQGQREMENIVAPLGKKSMQVKGDKLGDMLVNKLEEAGKQRGHTGSDFPYGFCLDIAKCFDSVGSAVCVEILRRLSVPKRICDLLSAQQSVHQWWVSFGDTVCPRPVISPLGLPQGDPWSHCALTLFMLFPLLRQHRPTPGSRNFLFSPEQCGHTEAFLR